MKVPESDLKSFILDSGLVSRKDVDAAEALAKERAQSLGDVLVSNGTLSSDALRRTKAYVLGIPFVNLKEINPSFEVLSLIPEPIARARNVIAYKKSDRELEVAMLDTEDLSALDSVRTKTGLKILPRLTDEESIRYALLEYQKSLKEEFGNLITSEVGKLVPSGESVSVEDQKRLAEDLPIVRIVDTLLRHAVLQNASDVHIETLENEVLVRYRIDGVLRDAMTLPPHAGSGITARIKVLANLTLDEKRAPQDGRFKLQSGSDSVSFRVSFLPTYFGEKVVLRLLREAGEGFTLDTLGFHGESLERIHEATRQTGGLILVTGPIGSGKTTTLYTLLDILNTPGVSIATVEDPVEYQMKRVSQTQVSEDTGFTYAHALRAVLRQDPDIIMVGEIRDAETAALAVHAARSGRLVLSTVAADSAADSIVWLIGMGVEPAQLAAALRLVIGQRLVRTLCDIKEAHALDASSRAGIAGSDAFAAVLGTLVIEKLVKPETTIDSLAYYKPVPSTLCDDGYRGHIGIQEVLTISPAVREHIARGASTRDIENQARKEGMLTLLEDGLYKAARGITSIDEVLRTFPE